MKRLRTFGALCALLTLVPACGARVAPEGTAFGATQAPVAAQLPAGDQPAGDTVASADPAPASPPPPASPPAPAASPAAQTPANPKHNNGAVRIEFSAACISPGEVQVITLHTPPKAGLAMTIGFADGRTHGSMLTGESDANGIYIWRVPIEPTVPDGDARALVMATGPNWEQEGGGSTDAVFRVARAGC